MIFVSAGHNSQSKNIKQDPGAMANGYKEGDLAIILRNLVTAELTKAGVKFSTDSNEESLSQYLSRIQTGNGSVVLEFHFDAATPAATGATSLIGTDADRLDKAFAKELVDTAARIQGINNRGVKSEAESHRGRLGLMREQGIVCLLEVGFITNIGDLNAFLAKKELLAKEIALILVKYENMI
jgi:N-acetylmuramoyl-L-alanine amidase